MRQHVMGAVLAAAMLTVPTSGAWAFGCPSQFQAAQAAIDAATKALGNVKDKTAYGLVHTLVDDAKMLLLSAKHNHEKPAAGKYDHARSMAKAGAAKAAAEAAVILADRS